MEAPSPASTPPLNQSSNSDLQTFGEIEWHDLQSTVASARFEGAKADRFPSRRSEQCSRVVSSSDATKQSMSLRRDPPRSRNRLNRRRKQRLRCKQGRPRKWKRDRRFG